MIAADEIRVGGDAVVFGAVVFNEVIGAAAAGYARRQFFPQATERLAGFGAVEDLLLLEGDDVNPD